MSRWPLLFRILLCLALLVNAAGTAAASAVHLAGSHAHAGTPEPLQAADGACHDTGVDQEQPSSPAPDCCDDGACTTCTGFGQALPPQPLPAVPGWSASQAPPLPAPGHASAALSRLVRPPIG